MKRPTDGRRRLVRRAITVRAPEASSAADALPQHPHAFGRLGPSRPATPPVLGPTAAGRGAGRRSIHDLLLAALFPLLGLFPLAALVLISLRGCR